MVLNNSKTQESSPYETSTSSKDSTETPEVATLRAYFDLIDGSPQNYESVHKLLKQVFHADIRFVIGQNNMLNYDELQQLVKTFCDNGGRASIERLKVNPLDGSITVIILNTLPGEEGELSEQTYYYEEGKMIKGVVSPENSREFKQLKERIAALPQVQEAKFHAYFDALDGSPDQYKRGLPLLSEFLHPDFRLEYGNGKALDYGFIKGWCCHPECTATVESMKRNTDGSLTAVIKNVFPGEPDGDRTEQTFYYEGTKIVRGFVSPQHETQFASMLERVKNVTEDEFLAKYRAFIGCFDGSQDAYSNKAHLLMDDLFDPHVRIVTDPKEEPKGMDFFINFCRNYESDGNVTEMLELERTEAGLRTVIRNKVKGKDVGAAAQRGIIKDGKIVYWEAVPGDEKEFQLMVDSVMNN